MSHPPILVCFAYFSSKKKNVYLLCGLKSIEVVKKKHSGTHPRVYSYKAKAFKKLKSGDLHKLCKLHSNNLSKKAKMDDGQRNTLSTVINFFSSKKKSTRTMCTERVFGQQVIVSIPKKKKKKKKKRYPVSHQEQSN